MSGAFTRRKWLPRGLELLLLILVILLLTVATRFAFLRFYRSAYPIGYAELVQSHSEQSGLPPELVYAVIRTESGFDPSVSSSVGARGLMQITEDTFKWARYRMGEDEIVDFEDLYEPDTNIRYGCAILRLLLDEFDTVENALCAYHAGWGSAKKWLADPRYSRDGEIIHAIPFDDTRAYVAKVTQTMQIYHRLYKDKIQTN